jgi:hypothetical protein
MHMMKKGQVHQGMVSAQNEVKFIHKLFETLLEIRDLSTSMVPKNYFLT